MATDPAPPNDDELAVSIETEQVRILQQILASDTGALILPELVARNNLAENSIRDILTTLRNRDPALVTTITPDETPPNHISNSYLAVTEYDINILRALVTTTKSASSTTHTTQPTSNCPTTQM